jgi:hypothetical protein
MAVAYGSYKFVTVSLPKLLRNGRFTSETAARRFQKRNGYLDPEVVGLLERRRRWAEAMGVVIGKCVKYPGGPP